VVCLRFGTIEEEEEEEDDEAGREGGEGSTAEDKVEKEEEEGEDSSRPLKKSRCLLIGMWRRVCNVCFTSLIVLQLLSVRGRFPPPSPPSLPPSPCCW